MGYRRPRLGIVILLVTALLAACTARPSAPTLAPEAAEEIRAAGASASVLKQPYLIYEGDNTQMTVLWQLSDSAPCLLEWGEDASYAMGWAETAETDGDMEAQHLHAYTMTDLRPGTTTYYRVTAGEQEFVGSFVTAPPDEVTALKFVVYGDTRSGTETHDTIAGSIISEYTDDSAFQTFLLHTGDLVSSGAREWSWDNELFHPDLTNVQDMLAHLPLQACIGNHELSTGGGGADLKATLFKKYLPYPFVEATYWSFDYGPAHFVMVDQETSYPPISPDQVEWIENDLASTTKPWKFVAFHEPAWSAFGGHADDTFAQQLIQPLCEEYGVAMVFAGHNHYYARAEVNGVVHITTGGGGAPLYAPDPGSSPDVVVAEKCHHYCKVELNGDALTFTAVEPDGTVIDAFDIQLN
jgi:hypothetical protein